MHRIQAETPDREVFADREAGENPFRMPVPRQEDDPGLSAEPGTPQRYRAPVQHCSPAAVDQPGQRPHELTLTVAVDARKPDDLAFPQLERYVRKTCPAEGFDLEDDVTRRVSGFRRKLPVHRAADDELDNLMLAQAGSLVGALALTVPRHRQPICDFLHFANSVRNIDHATARRRDAANAFEQAFDVLGQKVLGRLVKHEHLWLSRQGFYDLDDESLLRIQTEDARSGVDRKGVAPLLQKPLRPPGEVHQGWPFGLGHPEVKILGYGQFRHQGRLLPDDGQP